MVVEVRGLGCSRPGPACPQVSLSGWACYQRAGCLCGMSLLKAVTTDFSGDDLSQNLLCSHKRCWGEVLPSAFLHSARLHGIFL